MKTLLTAINSKYIHTNLALRYLYGVLDKKETTLKEYTINMPISNIIMDITENEYDLICFSVYIWNIEITLKIANILKEINPNIKILLGGPEVTYKSKKVLEENEQIDYIMLGEGEEIFPKFIEQFKENNITLENITRRENGKIIEGKIAKVVDTNNIPRVAQMLADEYDGRIIYFETSRGCPFRCSYCLSSIEKTVRPFEMNRVKEELKILLDKNVKIIKFVDRTFNYDKKRALEIWKFIIENRKDTMCHFEIAAHILDDETIEFLKTVEKNAIQFEIGVQTTNENTIKEIDRNTNFDRIKECILKLKEAKNIHFHLDLIAGLPYENYDSFKKSFDDVYALSPECLQLGFLKLLSGCKITNEKEKHGYKYMPYPPYEVLSNKYISYEELKRLKNVETVLDIYNNSEVFKNTIKYILTKTESAFSFYEELSEYYYEKGYTKISISLEQAFDILYEYVKEKFDVSVLREYLKLDYNIKFNSKRYWLENDNGKDFKKYIDNIIDNCDKYEEILGEYKNLSNIEKYKVLKFVRFNQDILNNNKNEAIYIFDKNKKQYIGSLELKTI